MAKSKRFGGLLAFLSGGSAAAVEAAVDKAPAPAVDADAEDGDEDTFSADQLEAAVQAAVSAQDKRVADVFGADAALDEPELAATYLTETRLEAADIVAKLEARAQRAGGSAKARGPRGTGGVDADALKDDKDLRVDTGRAGQKGARDGTGDGGDKDGKVDRTSMKEERRAARAERNKSLAGSVPANSPRRR